MGLLRAPALWLTDALPESLALKNLFKRYLDRVRGENNPDMASNGELLVLKKLLPECNLVFDVGANVGDWTALALKLKPGLELHCFEPSPSTFQALKRRHFPTSVRLNPFGLGQARGASRLFQFGGNSAMGSMFRRTGLEQAGIMPSGRSEKIRIETLDHYVRERKTGTIDLLKLDVEGNELAALRGMRRCLALGKIRFLQFEYGGTFRDSKTFLKDLFDFLGSFPAYRFFKIFPGHLKAVPAYTHDLDNFEYSNWLVTCEPGTLVRTGLWRG